MEKTLISTTQLFISILLYGGNTIIFLYYLHSLILNIHLLQYLTCLSYYANSIFLLLCLICDISLYMNNSSQVSETDYQLMEEEGENKSNNDNLSWAESLNNWNRNKFGVICNTFSFFVSISFWILYFLGEQYIIVSNTFFGLLSSLNLHLIITLLVIVDIFASKREHRFSDDYYSYISFIFLGYCFITGIDKYLFNINPYAFMNGSIWFLILYVFLSFVILYVSYVINVYLINCRKEEDDEVILVIEK